MDITNTDLLFLFVGEVKWHESVLVSNEGDFGDVFALLYILYFKRAVRCCSSSAHHGAVRQREDSDGGRYDWFVAFILEDYARDIEF